MRAQVLAVFAVLFATASAGAQDSNVNAPKPPPALEQLNNCDAFYPSVSKLRGVTYLWVHVDAVGHLRRASVIRSSGDNTFDNAALECSPHLQIWHQPQNGSVAEFEWVIAIMRENSGKTVMFSPNPNTGSFNGCASLTLSEAAKPYRNENMSWETEFTFRISSNGDVVNPVITKSSGRPDQDDFSMACIRTYKYFPAYRDGKPTDIEWSTVTHFNWTSGRSYLSIY